MAPGWETPMRPLFTEPVSAVVAGLGNGLLIDRCRDSGQSHFVEGPTIHLQRRRTRCNSCTGRISAGQNFGLPLEWTHRNERSNATRGAAPQISSPQPSIAGQNFPRC